MEMMANDGVASVSDSEVPEVGGASTVRVRIPTRSTFRVAISEVPRGGATLDGPWRILVLSSGRVRCGGFSF